MDKILKKIELKEKSKSKKLWDDFCKSENSFTTLPDNISVNSKSIAPILSKKCSTDTMRTLSITEIDTLISRANAHQKRLHEEVDAIKKTLGTQEPVEDKIDPPQELVPPIGSITARSISSAKSENLSEFHFSHRSSNHGQADDIHMYKLVLDESNSSPDEKSIKSAKVIKKSTYKLPRKAKSAQGYIPRNLSKYQTLTGKEHLELQRILGIESLLERSSATDRSVSPDPYSHRSEKTKVVFQKPQEISSYSSQSARDFQKLPSFTNRSKSSTQEDRISSYTNRSKSSTQEDRISLQEPEDILTSRTSHEKISQKPQELLTSRTSRASSPINIEQPYLDLSTRYTPSRHVRIKGKLKKSRSLSPKKLTNLSGNSSLRSNSPRKATPRIDDISDSVCNLVETVKNEKQGLLSRITEYQEKICDILIKLRFVIFLII